MRLLKTSDGSYTLLDTEQQETYHSRFGARSETDQVYLRNSGAYRRLQSQQATSILEIGFGTGFNFLHTARHAIESNCTLHYTACEMSPVDSEIALELLTRNAADASQLCRFTADALAGIAKLPHTGRPYDQEITMVFEERITLHLHRVNACNHQFPVAEYDAIYLDAFSKKNNPSLWSAEFLRSLHLAAKPDATLATYCVNGEFRRALTAAGFSFQKLPGPAGKREVLVATPVAVLEK